MTKIELINHLKCEFSSLSDDTQVMILDGFNGGGRPRKINFGPSVQVITSADARECADCEDLVGKKCIILGFGSY